MQFYFDTNRFKNIGIQSRALFYIAFGFRYTFKKMYYPFQIGFSFNESDREDPKKFLQVYLAFWIITIFFGKGK